MRRFLAACLWIALPVVASAQIDTLKTGIGEPITGFYLGTGVDSARVAIRLPANLDGKMIYSIRFLLRTPVEGPTDPAVWAQNARFTWGLSQGSGQQPISATSDKVTVPLNSNPDLALGGWSEAQVEWPVLLGYQYWLVGYWHRKAPFIRLTQNQRDPDCNIAIGYRQEGVDNWQEWYSSGLIIEIAYGEPGLGVPSGILDIGENATGSRRNASYAAINGSTVSVYLNIDNTAISPYRLEVVNILGQSVVSTSGYTDGDQLRVLWSAGRPSGVYFCRIRLGDGEVQTIPVVNVK